MKTILSSMLAGVLLLLLFTNTPAFSQDTCWWQEWERCEENPLILSIDETSWFSTAVTKAVLHENGIYRMWFSAWEPGTEQLARVGYAESENGIDWEINSSPVMQGGPEGSWNCRIFIGSVLRVDDTLRMWFTGTPESWPADPSIGYAWSIDGESWNINILIPFLEITPGELWNSYCEVIYAGNTYHLYYTDLGEINYATSEDGINWEIYDDNPVMTRKPGSFYQKKIHPARLVNYNDTLHMWFTGGSQTIVTYDVGYAWTTDYVTWNVHDDVALPKGAAGQWDNYAVFDAEVLLDDGIFKMWYTGWNLEGDFRIGYATGADACNLCLANGYDFNSQLEIDNFQQTYPYCQQIVGDVTIKGTDIKNLTGLGQINSFEGQLKINNNDSLESLNGLDEVTSIAGKFTINGNPMLNSLQHLSSLTHLGDRLQVTLNENLENFIGLEGLSWIASDLFIGRGDFGPAGNPNLISLIGLENLDSVGGTIEIKNNEMLSLCAIESICNFIDDPDYDSLIVFENNATECNSLGEVDTICNEISGTNDMTMDANSLICYPNPFKVNNTLEYALSDTKHIYLAIYNLLGEELQLLVNREQSAGDYKMQWDAHEIPPGVYFVVFRKDEHTSTKKLIKME